MGNICCQTDVERNPLESEILKFDDFVETEVPEGDQFIQQWISNNRPPSENGEQEKKENASKLMKHQSKDIYYYGVWVDQIPQGRGFIYQPEKLIFDGAFHKGLPDGKANIKFLDRDLQFEGELKGGQAHGDGTIDDMKQKYRFVGNWENSRPKQGDLTLLNDNNISNIKFEDFTNGIGVISYKDNRKYEGQIDTQRLVPHGDGTVIFPDGSSKVQYKGEWMNGQIYGKGIMTWRDGSTYNGHYINGKKEGYGKFVFVSQNYYEGYWQQGKQEGLGTLFSKNGEEQKKGIWKDGKFQKPIEDEEQIKKQSFIYEQKYSKISEKLESSGYPHMPGDSAIHSKDQVEQKERDEREEKEEEGEKKEQEKEEKKEQQANDQQKKQEGQNEQKSPFRDPQLI